jgi:hypothetical protein
LPKLSSSLLYCIVEKIAERDDKDQ